MPHTELAGNSGGGGMVRGVDSTLGGQWRLRGAERVNASMGGARDPCRNMRRLAAGPGPLPQPPPKALVA
jgi:hypothetical protein